MDHKLPSRWFIKQEMEHDTICTHAGQQECICYQWRCSAEGRADKTEPCRIKWKTTHVSWLGLINLYIPPQIKKEIQNFKSNVSPSCWSPWCGGCGGAHNDYIHPWVWGSHCNPILLYFSILFPPSCLILSLIHYPGLWMQVSYLQRLVAVHVSYIMIHDGWEFVMVD